MPCLCPRLLATAPLVAALAALAAALVLAIPATVRAAEPTGYGELTRFAETGDLEGQLDETRTRLIGVNPSDNSVYTLDEPLPPTAKSEHTLRLQKFTDPTQTGKYALEAEVTFTETAPEVKEVEPTVEGLAVDPVKERVYLMLVDARKKSLSQASETPSHEGLLVASTLYAFSTKAEGKKLVAAAGTKTGVLTGPSELQAQSTTPGQALLAPHGITVDPETHELIILAHVDEGSGKEDNLNGANDHYALQRISEPGALASRYVDKKDVLKEQGGFSFLPTPHSPIVVSAEGKERVYLGYGGLAEVPYDFTSTASPHLLAPARNPESGIEEGVSGISDGGRLSAASDGTVYGANTAGIKNEQPGGEYRAGIVAYSGADGSVIGWTGGQQIHSGLASCALTARNFSIPSVVAAGSGGKVFVLSNEFLRRFEEGEPIIKLVENPPGSGEFEEIEEPTFIALSPPFFPAVVEFGPGGGGCLPASATTPSARVNGIEIKGEETVRLESEVTFSSELKQTDALKVEWDFGDGSKETVASRQFPATSVKHKFKTEGNFTVTETIYSDDLASPSQTIYKEGHLRTPTIIVSRTIAVGKRPPTVQFTWAPGEPIPGQAATFTSHSSDPNGAEGLPLKYEWSFGDGASTTTAAASAPHAYAAAGRYAVTLTVTDNLGLKSSAVHEITVKAPSTGGPPITTPAPPAPPPPPSPAPGGGVLSYKVTIAGTSIAVSASGALALKVNCAGQSSCSGTVTLRSASAVAAAAGKHKAILTLASGSFTIAAGHVKSVTLHLSSKARTLLKRSKTLKARATIVARDAAGASHTTQLLLTLRASKHH